jgi:hypothetical protein
MITIHVVYPNNRVVVRNVYASQAQMIIDNSRNAGATVIIVNNPTSYIIR